METTLKVPSAEGRNGRTIAARLLPGMDMLEGIEFICKQHKVLYGVIACCIGSLSKTAFVLPVSKASAKIGIAYGDPIDLPGPVELLSGQGVICQSEDGEYLIHFHATVADRNMKLWGGHFIAGNIVLATIDLVIAEMDGMKLLRRFEEETGFLQFSPERRL